MKYFALGIVAFSVCTLVVITWMYCLRPSIQYYCKWKGIKPAAWARKQVGRVAITVPIAIACATVVSVGYWTMDVLISYKEPILQFIRDAIIFSVIIVCIVSFLFLVVAAGFRITHCYNCKRGLDSRAHARCSRCGWIVCPSCGSCGCGYG